MAAQNVQEVTKVYKVMSSGVFPDWLQNYQSACPAEFGDELYASYFDVLERAVLSSVLLSIHRDLKIEI
jgi:hypothetical protein